MNLSSGDIFSAAFFNLERGECLMEKSVTHYENIGRFISNVNGNWRNSIYVTCSICRFEKQNCCSDILLSFDGDGVPSFIAVTDANYVFAQIIDKSECLLEFSNARCECLFENLIAKNTDKENGCPLLQLTRQNHCESELF